ncbi:MAG: DUF4838 domain-containing protein [Kiritimatiellae bacterium]|nr:DUF4838 domain-containing protein [Kiritimatiellia bacterium]
MEVRVLGCLGFLLTAVFSSAASSQAPSPIEIDATSAVILSTSPATKEAANELRIHLNVIASTDVPVSAKPFKGAYEFRFEPCVIDGNAEACSWEVTPTATIFRGEVYFAVIDFLEDALGVRWPQSDIIACDVANPIRPKMLSGSWKPELKLRGIRGFRTAPSYHTYLRRMRAGRHNAPSYGHAFTKYWGRFWKTHREYFAMRSDGVRGPVSAKPGDLSANIAVALAGHGNDVAMCCTSTGFIAQVVADWVAAGKKEYINLCENDVPGQHSCQCKKCKALDVVPANVNPKWETHYSDRYVYLGNEVLKIARKYRADVKVCYYAYNATQDAPQREKPDPATVVGVVPTYFDNEYIHKYVGSWKEAGVVNFFYRPNRHCYYDLPYLPIGAERHFFGVLQYLVSQGCIGFDYDSPGPRRGGFEWFENYLLLHAMQDPSKPFEYWENHYFESYGAAASDVKAYFRYWREEVWQKRLEPARDKIVEMGKCFNFGRGLLHNLGSYYTADDFAVVEKHLAAAEAKTLNASRRELMRRLRMAHEHTKVYFNVVSNKTKENTEALIKFRTKFGYPLYSWQEQYYGDITGVEELLGPEKKEAKK